MYNNFFIFILVSVLSCKQKTEKSLYEKLTVEKPYTQNDLKFNKNDSLELKFNNTCDSLLYTPKACENPNKDFLKAINLFDLALFKNQIDFDFFSRSNYESFDEYLSEWKANDRESTFWSYYKNYMNMKGVFLSDTVYAIPLLSLINLKNCNFENKLLLLDKIDIYQEASTNSQVIKQINENNVLIYDEKRTIIPFNEYVKEFPPIEEFNSKIWYYIPKLKGYVKNDKIIDLGSVPTFYFEYKKDINKWLLSEIVNFD